MQAALTGLRDCSATECVLCMRFALRQCSMAVLPADAVLMRQRDNVTTACLSQRIR